MWVSLEGGEYGGWWWRVARCVWSVQGCVWMASGSGCRDISQTCMDCGLTTNIKNTHHTQDTPTNPQPTPLATKPPTHSFGQYDLHDLVQLDNAVGVVVSVEKDACQVLTNMGQPGRPDIRTCKASDIRRRFDTGQVRR